jgi:hypothetical protein
MPTPTNPKNRLSCELYDLMKGPSGASSSAIQAKPGLMSLSYIRTEAPRLDDREAQETAVAVTAQGFIEEATYALDKPTSQRPHRDAEDGAAARYLLALEQGATSMPLHERRKRAAECLRLDAASLRHRYVNKATGLAETRETKLMDAVADKLLERETDFLRAQSSANSGSDGVAGDSHWLAAAHNAWDTARRLSASLELCSGFHRFEPDIEYDSQRDYASLEWFAKFWQYIEIPAEDSHWFAKDDEPEPGRASLSLMTQLTATIFGKGLPEILFVSSPFDRETIERFSTEIAATPDADPSPIVRELITPWQAWLESCPCPTSSPDPKSCKVHWFYSSLEQYIDELHKCWDELRDPYHTPAHFGNDSSPSKIFERYGLRIPSIDKNN